MWQQDGTETKNTIETFLEQSTKCIAVKLVICARFLLFLRLEKMTS